MFEVSRVNMKPDVSKDCGTDDLVRCPPPPKRPLQTLPKVVHRVEPKPGRISGTVILRIGIRRDGSVGGVCVLKPLPCGLNTAAIEAVRQWKFEPRPDGVNADAIADVEVHFPPASTSF